MSVTEIKSKPYDHELDESTVGLVTQYPHPFWHLCRKCWTGLKIVTLVVLADVLCELVTFMPVHHLFEALGWIK